MKDEKYVTHEFLEKLTLFLPEDQKISKKKSDPLISPFSSEKTLQTYIQKVNTSNIPQSPNIYAGLSYENEFYPNFNYQNQNFKPQTPHSYSHIKTPVLGYSQLNISEFSSPLVIYKF